MLQSPLLVVSLVSNMRPSIVYHSHPLAHSKILYIYKNIISLNVNYLIIIDKAILAY